MESLVDVFSSVEGSWRGGELGWGGGVGPDGLGEEWFELEIGAAGAAMDQNERERVDVDALWQAPEISDALSSTEFCLPRLDEEFTWHAVPVVESNAVTMQEHYKATLQRLATTGTVLVKEEDDDDDDEHKEGSPVPEYHSEEQNAGPLVKLG
jgi:hypothetical protein